MNIDRPHSPNSPDRIAAFGGLPADHAVQTKNVDGFRCPLVSVVIPTRNRPARLCECLLALFAQSFDPDDFEIIVVDDGSQPPIRLSEILTTSVVAAKKLPTVRLIRQDCQGPAMARNQGAFEARGTLLAFIDDDYGKAGCWIIA
ncbi:MAG: glycosyltransferase family 2 protein [Planctomycetaceae bacterium]